MTDAWLVALQILVAAGLGAMIGLEREMSAQPGGRVVRLSHTPDRQALVITARPRAGESLAALGERLRTTPGVDGVDLSA